MTVEQKTLSRSISDFFWKEELTLATAESCTAGNVAAAITAIPGSSKFYKGGVVAYANETKENLLHVSHDTLVAHGAVSEETITEMIHGALQTFGTDYAVATSGISGPAGGTPDKPVGTIWIAAGNKDKILTQLLSGDEGREINIQNATVKALQLLLKFRSVEEK
ncbi:MAG: CinA family protein [Phocaeicola sp.]|nr:CinA family protein [Phocaeicola sp.]MDD7449086.1 CinA family protein [Prevotellaceae bacterium]MDY3913486.1 CinA family protein [Phocaeicola sp.]MDY5939526.1 CinA family protein [Phocaeicola sp.]